MMFMNYDANIMMPFLWIMKRLMFTNPVYSSGRYGWLQLSVENILDGKPRFVMIYEIAFGG